MKPALAARRVGPHGLARRPFTSAADVVGHLTAVQSQLPSMAWWGIARRCTDVTLVDISDAFDRGDLLRTHVLRPTWHFVLPADAGWLLSLTAPRVQRLVIATSRTAGLDDRAQAEGTELVVQALRGSATLTRSELAALLSEAGLPHEGTALAHIMMQAELDARICSGPMRGASHTYRSMPSDIGPSLPRTEALATLARRYGRGHGPFRDRDLAWWSSLTLTDARKAITLAELSPLDIDGTTYWTEQDGPETDVDDVMLLPNFDEYISYARDDEDYAAVDLTRDQVMRSTGLAFERGRLVGRWSRRRRADRVEIGLTAALRSRLASAALDAELDRLAHFFGTDVTLVTES